MSTNNNAFISINILTGNLQTGKQQIEVFGGMAEWSKAAVLKTVECNSSVGSNPTPSAIYCPGEMAELAEGARLLSE